MEAFPFLVGAGILVGLVMFSGLNAVFRQDNAVQATRSGMLFGATLGLFAYVYLAFTP